MDVTFEIGGASVGPVGMTLAAIAYADSQAGIVQYLADPSLATAGRWTLVWFARDAANQVFIARDGATGQQAVVIRGSVTAPLEPAFWFDWFGQDLSVFHMARWPYDGAPEGSRLSHGALAGLGSLLFLKNADKQSLVAFLRAHPGTGPTAVIGHSLGGALAYVLAAYLSQELKTDDPTPAFWPVTFAAPTVGNAVFAAWLDQALAASSARFWNCDDVVPHAWMEVAWIAASFPAGPSLPAALVDLVKVVRHALSVLGDRYVQPGAGQVLSGSIAAGDDWFREAGLQHSGPQYLALLGAPPLDEPRPAGLAAG